MQYSYQKMFVYDILYRNILSLANVVIDIKIVYLFLHMKI